MKGEVAERVSPDVPESATKTIHGTIDVKVKVSVDSNGTVSNASFDSPGHSRYFANQALAAAGKWRFTPPHVNGAAVSSQWILHFRFRRDGTDIKANEVSP
jgi:TonB family protein